MKTGTQENDYHRNGVSGLGFKVTIDTESKWLRFDFYRGTECGQSVYGPGPEIPFSEFQILLDIPPTGPVTEGGFRSDPTQFQAKKEVAKAGLYNAYTLYAFRCFPTDSETTELFIGYYEHGHDETAFAVLRWDLVLEGNVRFMENSWRGDCFFDTLMGLGVGPEERL